MSLKLYAVSIILIATVFSCGQKNEKDEIDESLLNAAKEIKSADSALAKSSNVQPANAAVNPLAPPVNNAPVFSTPAQAQTQPAQPIATGPLNPAHGQPGHRCDINVGAPLNSKPPALPNANQATTISTGPANTTVQNAAQKTLPGMNPAHGQPGHRCDIAVGAPLNSKPATASNTVITNVPPPVSPVKLPADSSKN